MMRFKRSQEAPRRAPGQAAQAGFTLIETAIASLIMLVGLLVVAQLFVLAALYNHSSKQTTLATTLAQRKLEELLAQPLTSNLIGYGGSLTSDSQNTAATANYYESYYVDPTTKQFSIATTGQTVSYKVRWQVNSDPGASPMAGLRIIRVRAEAMQAGLIGAGAGSANAAREWAELSTIRTPPQ